MTPQGRVVRLHLCDADGAPVGTSGPHRVRSPWWQEVEELVAMVAAEGLDVTVLRLLGGEPAPGFTTAGGAVTYLAELHAGTPPGPVAADAGSTDHPLRMPWARPGGPAAALAWAATALEAIDRSPTGRAAQVRTWNLSAIWRIPTAAGPCWLKVVPPFFGHEGAVVAWAARHRADVVPPLLAAAPGRSLFGHVPGEDQYDGGAPAARDAIDVLTDLQLAAAGRADDVLALGASDWRLPGLAAEIGAVVERCADGLEPTERTALAALVDGLDERLRDLDACGIPDTLVHGDFHTGNVRAGGGTTTVIDWGDSGVGHPLLDVVDLVHRLPAGDAGPVTDHAVDRWSALVPGAAVADALALLRPLALVRNAVVFDRFLAGIEPSERCYHEGDPRRSLQAAATVLLGRTA